MSAPKPPTAAEHKRNRTPSADVERALVDAAEAVLVRDGPGGVTVRAVAAQAGVAPMGIYNRFGGKDGLVAALLVRGFDMLRAAAAHRGEADPIERLRGSGLRYRLFALANPQYYAVMFSDAMPHDLGQDPVAEHADAAFSELVAHVSNALDAGRITGGEAFEIAQQLWSSIHGAVTLELNGLVLTPDAAATYEGLLETMLRGLRAETARP